MDKDKVKKGMECCSIDFHDECPYDDTKCCNSIMTHDALELIQEMEKEIAFLRAMQSDLITRWTDTEIGALLFKHHKLM